MSVTAAPKVIRVEQILDLRAERLNVEQDGVMHVELMCFTHDGTPIQVKAPTLVEALRVLRVRALRNLADLIERGETP